MTLRSLLVRLGGIPPLARRWARIALLAAIVGTLAWQLSGVGWTAVMRSLPTNPAFYALFVGLYLALPLSELLIYSATWAVPARELFAALLRKRVVNKDVVGYGGEFYLILWASRTLSRSKRDVGGVVRDNAVLSFVAITGWACCLLCFLLLSRRLDPFFPGGLPGPGPVAAAVLLAFLGAALVAIRFRRAMFSMSAPELVRAGALHGARVLVVLVLQIAQWSVAIPEVSLGTWMTFLAAQIVVSRLPILPSRDLIFAGIGIQLTGYLGIPVEPLAAMLLVSSALDKGTNLVLFAALSMRGSKVSVDADR